MRQRVLQFEGRRYSVRLEEPYWHLLERIAVNADIRLAKVIDDVALDLDGVGNLASALRLHCLAYLQSEAQSIALPNTGEVSARGAGYSASLENILRANPAPSLLLSDDGKILLANRAFQNWSGVKADALQGQPYDWFFQLRLSGSLDDTIRKLIEGGSGHEATRVSYIAPGRVVVANGLVCLGHYNNSEDFTWIVLIAN